MDNPTPHVLDSVLHGDAHAILVAAMTLTGVAVSYFFSIQADFDGTTKALKRLFPHMGEAGILRLDLIFVLLFGTLIAIAVCDPINYAQALGAGIGWVGLINLGGGRPKKTSLDTSVNIGELEQLRQALRTDFPLPRPSSGKAESP